MLSYASSIVRWWWQRPTWLALGIFAASALAAAGSIDLYHALMHFPCCLLGLPLALLVNTTPGNVVCLLAWGMVLAILLRRNGTLRERLARAALMGASLLVLWQADRISGSLIVWSSEAGHLHAIRSAIAARENGRDEPEGVMLEKGTWPPRRAAVTWYETRDSWEGVVWDPLDAVVADQTLYFFGRRTRIVCRLYGPWYLAHGA